MLQAVVNQRASQLKAKIIPVFLIKKITKKQQRKKTEASTEATESETLEGWGVWDKIVASNDSGDVSSIYICVPTSELYLIGSGLISYQADETLVICGGPHAVGNDYESITEVDKIFPAYFEQTIKIVENFRTHFHNCSDYAFKLTAQENIKINDYEMCRYTGVHTYTEENIETGEIAEKSMNFVAYATKIKENNAPVYWMVLDNSEDQSLGELIEADALNMAKTVHEDYNKYMSDII